MAKTSKTIPQKENASSSRLAGGKTPAEPRPEECVPRGCVLTSNFKTDKASSILDRCEPVSRYICSINEGYPKQDKKRKKTSPSEDPEPKKKAARKPRKNIILLTKEFVRRLREEDDKEEEDDSRMVARVGMSIEAPKATESVKAAETSSRDEGVSGRDFREVPKSSRIKEAPNHTEPMVGTTVEAPRDEENAPSDTLGAIEIGGSPLLPSFSEEMIQEARALKTLSIEGAHGSEDPFHDYFTGVEDTIGLSDLEVSRKDLGEASSLCSEAQQALNQASVLHREAFSQSRAELIGTRLTFKGLPRRGMPSTLSKKVERIEQFREEVNIIKAESLEWKEGMDCFAAEKETTRAQLSSVKSQLQGMKEKSSAQARKIEELKARLAFELAKAKSEAEKAKVEADVIVAIYRADAEATQVQAREAAKSAQTRAYWIVELAKCQSRRETLEEIHARYFDLTNEIVKARELEAETGALASSDDDDDDGSKSESENGEDLYGEEAALGENYEPYDFSLLIFCIGS
ncbi:protein MLP1 homolog [Nicotiana tomentosiformis]|uniref:protein MLP1 homolog n=1 Tax=Nicotiana tomentosiformis TaxID=4098 RepID=UPI00388CC813